MAKTRGVYRPSYRDKDGNLQYSSIWWIRYVDASGEMQCESSKSTRKSDAIKLLEQRRAQVLFGKLPQLLKYKKLTLKQFSVEYLQYCVNQKAFKQKEYVIERLLRKLGNVVIQDFTTKLIEQYRNKRISEGIKKSTINHETAILKNMFTIALDWDYINEQTMKYIRKVKQFPVDNGRIRYLKDDEYIRLMSACKDTFLEPIIMLALHTGMRKTELLSLTWDNIDMKSGFIFLNDTKNNESAQIPMNNTAREVLSNVNRRLDIKYIFYNPHTNKPFNNSTFRNYFISLLAKAEIDDFTFHDLRHTFGSYLAMAGVTLPALQKLMRHKDIMMTMRYIHLMPSYTTDAIKKLDAVFKPTIKKLKSTG